MVVCIHVSEEVGVTICLLPCFKPDHPIDASNSKLLALGSCNSKWSLAERPSHHFLDNKTIVGISDFFYGKHGLSL